MTARQERFCQEFIASGNATQSAISAGYAEKTARSQGQRLLTLPSVQNYLKQLAEEYEGFSEIECEDFIDLCDEYGITSEIEEDDFEEVKEKLEDMYIPEIDEEYM